MLPRASHVMYHIMNDVMVLGSPHKVALRFPLCFYLNIDLKFVCLFPPLGKIIPRVCSF